MDIIRIPMGRPARAIGAIVSAGTILLLVVLKLAVFPVEMIPLFQYISLIRLVLLFSAVFPVYLTTYGS